MKKDMERGGTYVVAGVMVGGGKWCFRCGVMSFVCVSFFCFLFFLLELRCEMGYVYRSKYKMFVFVSAFGMNFWFFFFFLFSNMFCVIYISDRSDFHMIDNLSIAVHAFARRILMSFSVDETLLPRYMNLSTNFMEPPFRVEMSIFWSCLHSHGGKCLPVPDYAAEISDKKNVISSKQQLYQFYYMDALHGC